MLFTSDQPKKNKMAFRFEAVPNAKMATKFGENEVDSVHKEERGQGVNLKDSIFSYVI